MPDIYSPRQNEEMRPIDRVPTPLSRYLSTAFASGQSDSVASHLNHILDDDNLNNVDPNARTLTADEANQKYGVGDLKFNQPVKEPLAQAMSEREKDKMDRDVLLYSGGTDLAHKAGAMAMQALGATANPVDFSSMFVPFVGEGKYALIARSAFKALPAPRLVESMVQASLWQATFGEIPRAIESYQEHQNISPLGVGGDLLGQAVFAAGLHGAGAILNRMVPRNREEMAKTAMNQWVNDEDVKVHDMIPLDQHVIEYQAMERDRQLRQEAANSIDQSAIRKEAMDKYSEYPIDAALRSRSTGEIRTGPIHSLIEGYENSSEAKGHEDYHPDAEWSRGFLTDKGRFIGREEADQMTGSGGDFLASESLHNPSDPDWLAHGERVKFDELKERGMTDAQALNEIRTDRVKRREQRLLANPDVQQDIQNLTQKAIADYIDKKRQERENPPAKEPVQHAATAEEVRTYTGDSQKLTSSINIEKEQEYEKQSSALEKWINEKAESEESATFGKNQDARLKRVSEMIREGKLPKELQEVAMRELKPTKDMETGETLNWEHEDFPRTGTLLNFLEERAQRRMPENLEEVDINNAVDSAINCILEKIT